MMTTIDITTVPFSKLVAVDEINARGKTREGIDELAAAIAAKGLIQPLAVRPGVKDGTYEIIDGRRRYQAIAKLVKDKLWTKTDQVPVIVRNEDDANALETSLMANTVRLPMHAVDQHDVFVRLVEQGTGEAEIAARFGITERKVKQQIALGRLAPVIRENWRKGKITAEAAQAFTIASHADQETAWSNLKGHGSGLSDYAVRRQLCQSLVPLDDYRAMLVGIDAYVAAGGTVRESLFDDIKLIEDEALLDRLVGEKLDTEAERIKADGWAFVARASDLPERWRNWKTIKGDDYAGDTEGAYRPEDYTPEERARSGVIIDLDNWEDNPLFFHTGVIRPDASGQTDLESAIDDVGDDDITVHAFDDEDEDVGSSESESGEAGPFAISDALMQSLTEAQTMAAQRALAADPHLALVVLLATLSNGASGNAPLRVSLNGYGQRTGWRRDHFCWADFVQYNGNTLDVLAGDLAPLIAEALDLRSRVHSSMSKPSARADVDALINRLPAQEYLAAAREAFISDDYFKRATKSVALTAIEEMREAGAAEGIAPEDVLAGVKKTELAETASDAAKACGWLPPELRHPAYQIGVTDTGETPPTAPKRKSKKIREAV